MLNAVLKAKSFDKVNNHDRHDRNRKPCARSREMEKSEVSRLILAKSDRIAFAAGDGTVPVMLGHITPV